jgi:hypothetical protein
MNVGRIHDLHYDRLLTIKIAVSSLRFITHIFYKFAR